MARNAVQDSLFGDTVTQSPPPLVGTPPWSLKERLMQEKLALGFYRSGHPFDADRQELAPILSRTLAQLSPQPQPQLLAGTVIVVRTQMARSGKMAFVLLDDGSAQVEVVVFHELYEARRDRIRVDETLVVLGKASLDGYSGRLRVTADEVHDLEQARTRYARRLTLTLNGKADAQQLRELLAPYRTEAEGCPILLHYRNDLAFCEMELGQSWRVRLAEPLLGGLRQMLDPEAVRVEWAVGGG